MKFKSNLDYYQNLRAWESHQMSAPHKAFDKLNSKQKAWLMQLNSMLTQLEIKFLPILNAKYEELQARTIDNTDWMMDFNLDYVITFYLCKDNKEFEADDDNILMQIEDMYYIKKAK